MKTIHSHKTTKTLQLGCSDLGGFDLNLCVYEGLIKELQMPQQSGIRRYMRNLHQKYL